MIVDPVFYAVALPALVITGISKGGFGAGVGIVAVPALTFVVPPLDAIAIMLPLLCLMDLVGIWSYRRAWSLRLMRYLFPGAVIGIVAGALTATWVDEHVVRLIIGLIAVLFALNRWVGFARSDIARAENPPRGMFWAAVSGFTSTVGHAGGPPLQVYMLPLKLDKTVFVGTTVIFFAAVNYTKLVPYAWLGLFTGENLATAAVLAPICPLAMWLGVRLHRVIPEGPFYRICYVFVFLVGLKLCFDGLRPLLA
ncbi:MAG: sulfite exporter TauE/SafE family protein [Pseudomonadota bacterium]|nr:sulfite exporter TauE/SafE family protein [Pseudomonadota bacterium]